MKGQTTAMEIPAIPVEEGVRLMAGDLERGRRFDKAVLLFAVYRAETTRAQAEALLEACLREMGFRIERARFPLADEPDWPYRLRFYPPDGDTAIFVYDLRKAFPEILQYLNYRREVFAEERVRAVFWVMEEEVRRLALEAPDFWAFRTQALEFLEIPLPEERAVIVRELAWWGFGERLSPDELEDRIALRERLLTEFQKDEKSTATRAELLYSLANLYCLKNMYGQALELYQQALGLAREVENLRLEAWAHNGLGNAYFELGFYEKAIAEYESVVELRRLSSNEEAIVHYSLGNIYLELSRYEEAIAEYERAIELAPKLTYPHNGLGNVYSELGRYEEAIAEFKRAIELDSKYATPHHGLGVVYRRLGHYKEAIAEYERAFELTRSSL